MQPSIAQRSVADLADDIAAGVPGYGGGVGAALTASLAASAVMQVARASIETWSDGDGIAGQAAALREHALELAEANSVAYARASEGLKPHEPQDSDRPPLGPLLEAAAEIPLRIATTAAAVAELAALAARHGVADRRADAVAAAALSEGATRTAAALVEVNLATLPGDARVAQARRELESAVAAREAAAAALTD